MLEKVKFIAKEAGNVIRDGFGKNFSIEFKTNESNIVTEIDKQSEKIIKEFINIEFPTHGILAEESGSTSGSSEYLWVIDPIDGTTNFAHGLPIFSVSIGVQKNGVTICGVVYDVMRDCLYSADLGNGCYLNNQKVNVNKNNNLKRSLLVTGFPYEISENPDLAIERFSDFLKNSRGVRRLGSAAIDLCYVASGIFEGYWEVNLQPWDMCAGIFLVEEAGGKATNFKNGKINIYSRQILATNGHVHESMLEILNKY